MSGALLAEFTGADDLLRAIGRTRDAGYRRLDTYTPFAVEGLAEALDLKGSRVRVLMFAGGVVAAGLGFFLQVWMNAIDYPLNIGGRPLFSWQAFTLVTFELGILGAAFAGFIGLLWGSGLPRPHHELFDVPGFDRVSQDRFFLAVSADDPLYDQDQTARFLEGLGALAVRRVGP